MKSILLLANEDDAFQGRLAAAIHLARQFDAKISCVQVTPYDSFIMGDPFGGVYALPTVVEQVGEVEAEHRHRAEQALKAADVHWEWLNYEGHPGHVMLERSRLADVAVVSLPGERTRDHQSSVAADLAIHARTPVLATPTAGADFQTSGTAMVAWNGSAESAHALRFASPMLAKAAAVHIVTIAGERLTITAAEAAHYLSQHGVEAKLHHLRAGSDAVAETLIDEAAKLDANYIVAGAYGHSRLRELVLGGVTRKLIQRSPLPLLLAH